MESSYSDTESSWTEIQSINNETYLLTYLLTYSMVQDIISKS